MATALLAPPRRHSAPPSEERGRPPALAKGGARLPLRSAMLPPAPAPHSRQCFPQHRRQWLRRRRGGVPHQARPPSLTATAKAAAAAAADADVDTTTASRPSLPPHAGVPCSPNDLRARAQLAPHRPARHTQTRSASPPATRPPATRCAGAPTPHACLPSRGRRNRLLIPPFHGSPVHHRPPRLWRRRRGEGGGGGGEKNAGHGQKARERGAGAATERASRFATQQNGVSTRAQSRQITPTARAVAANFAHPPLPPPIGGTRARTST